MTDKLKWLAVGLLVIIFFTRFTFLGADLPSGHVEIEEKAGGYNARNMVVLGHWPLYENWFQSMVYVPVQTLFSYVTFSLFGVGLAQLRLPMVLAGYLGLIFFFLFLLKQTNLPLALLGLFCYAFNFEVTVWNRSALTENLYLFFMPLAVYWLSRHELKEKGTWILVFIGALSIVAKLDGYPFLLALIIYLAVWSWKNRLVVRTIKAGFLGISAAVGIWLLLLTFFGAWKYFGPMYGFYFEMFGKHASFLAGILPTGQKMISLLLTIDAYLVLAFLVSLPVIIINHRRLNQTDWFMVVFLLVALVTRLQVPYYFIYWKRLVFLFFPFVYIVFRALYLLRSNDDLPSSQKPLKQNVFLTLLFLGIYSLVTIAGYLNFFSNSINRYDFVGSSEAFHYTQSSFIYLLLVMIAALSLNEGILIFGPIDKLKKPLGGLILFLVALSLLTNIAMVGKIYLPQNIKYSYQENQKYLSRIPESEMIVGHEQGFRALAYLRKNDYYFNHDGGLNPISYREVLERRDLRYFILNVEEFWREHWGLPNQIRLAYIKEAYPNLKLIEIIFASKVPLAIYDKYPTQ